MIEYIAILDGHGDQTVHAFWSHTDDEAIKLCEDNKAGYKRITLQTRDGRFVKEII